MHRWRHIRHWCTIFRDNDHSRHMWKSLNACKGTAFLLPLGKPYRKLFYSTVLVPLRQHVDDNLLQSLQTDSSLYCVREYSVGFFPACTAPPPASWALCHVRIRCSFIYSQFQIDKYRYQSNKPMVRLHLIMYLTFNICTFIDTQ